MNLLKERISHNEIILGTMLSEVTTPNIVRMLAVGGFEFVIVDCEHGYFNFSQAAEIVGIANGIHLPIIIRIPEIRREVITKYMDMGADGLLVPMTSTRKEIKTVVEYAKYSPLGKRGISTQRPHTEYNPNGLSQYMKLANQRTIIFAQIETREGVQNINDILSLEGVDGALIGPNDMSCDCGDPGNYDTKEMQNNFATVIAASKQNGKPCGIISGNMPLLNRCRADGMTIFSCNSETGLILSGAKRTVHEFYAR